MCARGLEIAFGEERDLAQVAAHLLDPERDLALQVARLLDDEKPEAAAAFDGFEHERKGLVVPAPG